jgi:hypothetical protein
MGKLSIHARVEIGLALLVLLGSCGDNAYHRFTQGDYDRLDAADVNARNAIARVDELESRVSDLEQRLGR